MQDEENIKQAMDAFTADIANIRFIESAENWDVMEKFLSDHNLDATSENLRFAFLALSKDQKLDLMPLGVYEEPQPQPAPAPTPQPSVPVKARTIMYRNGQPIDGTVKRYGDK